MPAPTHTTDTWINCIAANADEVRELACRMSAQVRYIDSPRKLFGQDGHRRSILVTRAAYERPDINTLLTEAALRGFGFIHV